MKWFLNKKIATKLGISFSVLLLLVVFLGVYSIYELSLVEAGVKDLGTQQIPANNALGDMENAASAFRRWELRLAILQADPKSRQAVEDGFRDALNNLKKAQTAYEPLIDDRKEQALYEGFKVAWAAYMDEHQKFLDLVHANRAAQANELLTGDSERAFGKMFDALEADLTFQDGMTSDAIIKANHQYTSARLWTIVVLCVCVAIGALLAMWVSRLIARPVVEVGEKAKQIAGGDLSGDELAVRSMDETGELGRDINMMQKNIREIILAISENATQVATASEEFSATSQQISTNSEETSAQASVVSNATTEVNRNLQSVATASEEMSSTVSEIAKNAASAAKFRHQPGYQGNHFDCPADEPVGPERHHRGGARRGSRKRFCGGCQRSEGVG
jgi:methyl-accepting chemotaxis protein